jgi:uncharacterized membrane protein YphA (DoxX/SURF4 family)
MHILEKIERWGETHHPWWVDVFRGALGVILIIKGIHILSSAMTILSNVENHDIIYASFILIHFIAIAHISGGVLIALGLMTRFAIMIQFPIILCALIIVNFPGKLNFAETENELILLVLLLIFFILVEGSGKHSIDRYMKKHPEA